MSTELTQLIKCHLGMQVNWEAILQPSRDDFISYIISQWIRTSVKVQIKGLVGKSNFYCHFCA